MAKEPKKTALPAVSEARNTPGEFLVTEYTSLVSLYTHAENALFSVFNFYITVLSAITGAVILLVQINSADIALAFPSITILLVLILMIGIITQDAIVSRNAELSKYALALNLLKHRLLEKWPEEFSHVMYLSNSWAEVLPFTPKKLYLVDRIHKKFWWMLSLGTHQLFIGTVNSLCVTALALSIALQLSNFSLPSEHLVLAGLVTLFVSYQVQVIYARFNFKRVTSYFVTAAGDPAKWD